MDKKHHISSMMTHKVKSLEALLLSMTLGFLGIIFLLSVLDSRSIVLASQRENELKSSPSRILDTIAAPMTDSVSITKTVEPPNPDTGSVVSICFTIRGLGPRKLDVALAQDVSTSMNKQVTADTEQTRLQASKQAAIAFVNFLPSTDRTAVISYSESARVAQPLTTTKSAVIGTINGLTTSEWTNIGAGISASHKELTASPRFLTDTIKTIILLSDGIANRPVDTDTARIDAQDRATAAASDNVRIYTIGFGDDADAVLLQNIADIGGGKYFFAPDGEILATIYLSIALELRSLVVTDILTPGVDAYCSQWSDGSCVQGPSGVTTVTLPISNSLLVTEPVVLCFPATVNLDPNTQGPINLPGSGFCYQDSDGQQRCATFDNPPITVGGRKITGRVFHDLNANSQRDAGEAGAADVLVRTSADVTSTTDVIGNYVLRTSTEPAVSVTIEMPLGFLLTTQISHHIPPITGTYSNNDFGIYGVACVQGKVFDDVNANGQDDGEEGLAGATITASGGTALTTGSSGAFAVCAPVGTGPITITERDPSGYTSTAAINGLGVRVIDAHTLRIDEPEPGIVYGGNKFGDSRVNPRWSLYLPIVLREYLPFVNGGFENRWTGWTPGGELSQAITSTNPHSERFSALLGNPTYECRRGVPVGSAWIEQSFTVPQTPNPRLSFWYNIFTQDKNPNLIDLLDSFDVKINGLLVFRDARKYDPFGCSLDYDQAELGWQVKEVDLSDYRGQQITIRFENRSSPDGWYNTWTFVDDVRVLR